MNLKHPLLLLAAIASTGWPTLASGQVEEGSPPAPAEVVVFRALPDVKDPLKVPVPQIDTEGLAAWCRSQTRSTGVSSSSQPLCEERRSILVIPGETRPQNGESDAWRIAIARAPRLFPSAGQLPMQPILPGAKSELADRLKSYQSQLGRRSETRYPLEVPSGQRAGKPADGVTR